MEVGPQRHAPAALSPMFIEQGALCSPLQVWKGDGKRPVPRHWGSNSELSSLKRELLHLLHYPCPRCVPGDAVVKVGFIRFELLQTVRRMLSAVCMRPVRTHGTNYGLMRHKEEHHFL
jgi:hypothetical protein